jgi:uncharacterized protein YjlB
LILALSFDERGVIPNNPRFPALLYQGAFDAGQGDLAAAMEERFRTHGWLPAWRAGIFDYQHYHAQAHEVLGFYEGSATLVIGGDGGRELEVKAGDVLLLPAGTGHCRVRGEVMAVGAYPPGQTGDIRTEAPTPELRKTMLRLPRPQADPVQGAAGPMMERWTDGLAL